MRCIGMNYHGLESPQAVHYLKSLLRVDTHFLDNISFQPLCQADKEYLSQPYTVAEIKSATWNLGAWKAPGPDGILIGFYKEHWNIVGDKITNLALKILFRNGHLHNINATDLCLDH